MRKIIDLNRRFIEAKDKIAEEAAQSSYLSAFFGNDKYVVGLEWSDLLDHRIVIVLGEPGSGKTTEFRFQAETIRAKIDHVFYLELGLLARDSFEISIGSYHKEFLKWKKSEGKAYFFLDAVDEAKLGHPSDFFRALDKIRDAIEGKNLNRSHLILSSRISEWRPETDLSEVRKRFCTQSSIEEKVSEKKQDKKPDVLVVHLAPLDQNQVRKYAESLEIKNLDGFILALNEHHAWEFARRPWDVNALIEYWKKFGRLGSLKELIEENVNLALQERRDHGTLSPELARIGATALAASAIFCRNLNFQVLDANHISETKALNPIDCLPSDWTPAQSKSLLNRALFDGAAYGCIRFHHRREQEYLAALWLNQSMENGCPLSKLIEILFSYHQGQYVLRPSMAPIAAWLTNGEKQHHIHVRMLIITAAPEIHFKYGDPAQLPLDYKRQLLNSLAARYKDRNKAWIDSEAQSLTRLSDPLLAPDISKIILNRSLSSDFRSEMLLLARYGKLVGCLDAANAIIEDPSEDTSIKAYAAAMIRDVESSIARQRLAKYLGNQDEIPSKLIFIFCQTLYPNTIDADGMTGLLQKMKPAKNHIYEIPGSLQDHLQMNLSESQTKELFKALMKLVIMPPLHETTYQVPISVKFIWICNALPEVLLKFLKIETLTEEETTLAAQCIHLLEDHWRQSSRSNDKPFEEFPRILRKNLLVRRAYFWKGVEQFRLWRKSNPTWAADIYAWNSLQIVRADKIDIPWLIEDAINGLSLADRVIAINSALDAWNPYDMQLLEWGRMLKVQFLSHDIRFHFWKRTWIRLMCPLTRYWNLNVRWKLQSSHWWKEKVRKIQNAWYWIRNHYVLHKDLHHLYSGKNINGLWFTIHRADGGYFRNSRSDWKSIGKKMGPLIKWAARHGCEVAWHDHSPLLPHEKQGSNSIDHRVIIGLCGLQSLWIRRAINFDSLATQDAKKAARYALSELNEFTDWFPDLAKAKPGPVKAVLQECIDGEWLFPLEYKHANEVLAKISWSGEIHLPLISNELLEKLKEKDPLHPQVLESALRILLKVSDSNQLTEIADLIPGRIEDYDSENPFFSMWLTTWFELESGKALAFLEQCFVGMEPVRSDKLMLRLCSDLKGEWGSHTRIANPDYRNSDALIKLIPLVVRHVRIEEDIDRLGGEAYTPGMRDYAQEFRNDLIFGLIDDPRPESLILLKNLRTIPEMANLSERIEYLIDKQIGQRVDLPEWTPKDVQCFGPEYDIEPRNEESLFNIAFNRISDIKTQVERWENSPREEVQAHWDESELRKWLHRKLNGQSRMRYSITQESEIDLAQRPDLRFGHSKITSSIPVEIKWVENWSTNQLLESLENQLVGQYLRAENVHFGIFLLGRIDSLRRWSHPVDHRRIDFSELLRLLGEKAKELEKRQGIFGVRVLGIDFSIPNNS